MHSEWVSEWKMTSVVEGIQYVAPPQSRPNGKRGGSEWNGGSLHLKDENLTSRGREWISVALIVRMDPFGEDNTTWSSTKGALALIHAPSTYSPDFARMRPVHNKERLREWTLHQ